VSSLIASLGGLISVYETSSDDISRDGRPHRQQTSLVTIDNVPVEIGL
jgi:hypothetical protein